MSRVIVKNELHLCLAQINSQINVVRETATEAEILSYKLQDTNGNFILAPLLVAKAQVLDALSRLEGK